MNSELFYELLGWIGSFCFLFAYYKLIKGIWDTNHKIYHWYNIVGGALFVINAAYYQAWAVLFINMAWGAIACFGLYKSMKR